MANKTERNWTAQIVLSSEHAGLRGYFKALEAELIHVLARVDDPVEVGNYLKWLQAKSRQWLQSREALALEK